MESKRNIVSVLAIALMVVAVSSMAVAQSTTLEVKRGTVVTTYGNTLVVKMSDGTVRQAEVQEGFMFDVDGKPTPLNKLKPGTVLAATIKTVSTPHVVETEEIRRGKVLRRSGQTIIVRRENGEVVKFQGVPEGVKLTSNGRPVTLFDLREGMELTATIVSKQEVTMTERELQVAGIAPRPAPKPAARPAAVPAPAPMLPSTGSLLPLVGILGLGALALALGLGVLRRQ